MVKRHVEFAKLELGYYQKGADPALLIHTGTHGDEKDVIEAVGRYLKAHEAVLPDFIWVPEVSPSAVRLGTRQNQRGVDLNRVFFDGAKEPEVGANLAVLRGRRFRHFLSVHEDLTADRFYMYEHDDNSDTPAMARLCRRLAGSGIGLYEGLDDTDPVLCNEIRKGYFSSRWLERDAGRPDGTVEGYVGHNRLADGRIVTAEVPGLATMEKKDMIVAWLFEYLLSG